MTRLLRSVSVTTLTLFLSASAVGIHLPSEATTSAQSTRSSLAVRLGYSAQDKLLIVNADDLGMRSGPESKPPPRCTSWNIHLTPSAVCAFVRVAAMAILPPARGRFS
jgi:hypothetical protein